MLDEIKQGAGERMAKSVASLQQELTKIRTGRARTSLLDHVTVEYYGSQVPLNQVANIGVEDSRTLTVTPWEKDLVQAIEKAIMSSDLGLNPFDLLALLFPQSRDSGLVAGVWSRPVFAGHLPRFPRAG